MTRERLSGLERQAKSANWVDRQDAARDPRCQHELLGRLAEDAVYDVRAVVATNPNTPPEALKVLQRKP